MVIPVRMAIRRLRARWMYIYGSWRVKQATTRLMRPQFRRSRRLVEMDITYDCNLQCFNCIRSCQQAPSKDHLTLGQIRTFLRESVDRRLAWKRIRVMGGEPTLHPNFPDVIRMLVEYREKCSPATCVQVCTNGYGRRVQEALRRLPPEVSVLNTRKSSRFQENFLSFNVAPADLENHADADYANGCSIIQKCGFGLTPYGYYPCALAGGIDRIFGFDAGRKNLPGADDDMEDELRQFCPLCGIFRRPVESVPLSGPRMSPTWEQAYARWMTAPPLLTRLPESD
jgi:hypothetical protein